MLPWRTRACRWIARDALVPLIDCTGPREAARESSGGWCSRRVRLRVRLSHACGSVLLCLIGLNKYAWLVGVSRSQCPRCGPLPQVSTASHIGTESIAPTVWHIFWAFPDLCWECTGGCS